MPVPQPLPDPSSCRLTVLKAQRLAPHVLQLWLQAETAFRYREGQFLSLMLPDGACRSYSMANAYHSAGRIELNIRLIEGGQVSGWLAQHAAPGLALSATGPYGDCCWQAGAASVDIMLATGTGIAPIKAMIEQRLQSGLTRPLIVYWGARHVDDLYLQELFAQWMLLHPLLRFVGVIDDSATPARTVQGCAAQDHPDLSAAHVYACGGPAMVHAAQQLLTTQCGLPLENFHADAFEPASVAATSAPTAGVTLQVTDRAGQTQPLTVAVGQSLMQALAAAQVLQGVCGGKASCGTCRVALPEPWLARLPVPARAEARLLRALEQPQPNQRLACQIALNPELDGLQVSL